ncbi:MAG: adenylate kinase [Acidimicrobiia bacterium]
MKRPRRILVYGVTGSGKTTLARQIGEITGLPWHSMDDEVGWLPGWVERRVDEQVCMVAEFVASEAWVLDTAYGHWRDLVLCRADLVVALDYPRWVSFIRLFRRTMRRAFTRETVCNGNIETWRKVFSSDSILVWHFRSFTGKRSRIAAWEADLSAPPVVRLRSPVETERWLAGLRSERA